MDYIHRRSRFTIASTMNSIIIIIISVETHQFGYDIGAE
jgi:hypothetical protein